MKAIKIMQRLREPSTWAGIAALGLLVGLPAGTVEALGQIISGVTPLGAIFVTEAAKE